MVHSLVPDAGPTTLALTAGRTVPGHVRVVGWSAVVQGGGGAGPELAESFAS